MLKPDDTPTIVPGTSSDEQAGRVAELLDDDGSFEPLLFREWAGASIPLTVVAVAVLAAGLFLGLAVYFAGQEEFALVAHQDPGLTLFVAAGLVGLFVLVAWPLWRNRLEKRRGYRFGDYVMDFGYIRARPDEVTLRVWDEVTVETDDDQTVTSVRTSGDVELPIGEDFQGDHTRAIHWLRKYNSDNQPPLVRDLIEDYVPVVPGNFHRLRHGLVGPVVGMSAVAAVAVGVTGTPALQGYVQQQTTDELIAAYEETVEALREHETEAVSQLRRFGQLCREDVQTVLADLADLPAEESSVARLNTEVCASLSASESLTYFSYRDIYRHLTGSSDPAYKDVLLQRLSRYYHRRLEQLSEAEETADSEHADFATWLVEKYTEEPLATTTVKLRPVVAVEFEQSDLLVERLKRDDSFSFYNRDMDSGVDRFYVNRHIRDDYVSPDPYLSGEKMRNIGMPARDAIRELFSQVLGHAEVPMNVQVEDRRFSYQAFERDDFSELNPYHHLDDRQRRQLEEGGEADLPTLQRIVGEIPDVDESTVLITYEAIPHRWVKRSMVGDYRVYLTMKIEFVVQWICPDDGVVWEFDSEASVGRQALRAPGVNASDPGSVYPELYERSFRRLISDLEEAVDF